MRSNAVVVVHRQRMLAEGLASAVAAHVGAVPVAVVTTSEDAFAAAENADAMAIDGGFPNAAGLVTHAAGLGVRVVLLGGCLDSVAVPQISTDAPVSALASALVPRYAPAHSIRDLLTDREQEVLDLVAGGFAGKQVAKRLGISPKTVEQHKTRIFAKLGVNNQTAAVSVMLRHRPIGHRLGGSLSAATT